MILKRVAVLLAIVLMQCHSDDYSETNRCDLEPNPGPCKAYIIKYYYDPDSKSCKEFVWGGCGGVVPFQTLQECESGCGG
jgi:hypothetical protein